jgi:low temperature requirement protein LtrA
MKIAHWMIDFHGISTIQTWNSSDAASTESSTERPDHRARFADDSSNPIEKYGFGEHDDTIAPDFGRIPTVMITPKPWKRPMAARKHDEGHRQASWLELFFDLSFVVAVARAAVELEHAFAEGHPGSGIVAYLVVFAAIWWAWMTFTWFANVFDNDDGPYRVLMMIMIAGSLGLAAGVPQMAALDFRAAVASYVVMRLGYVALWVRVRRSNVPEWRAVSLRMVVLTTINQAGWILFLWVPSEWRIPAFAGWFAFDLAIPFIAGWDARTGGHRGHIVERYGLFTIIVLGESIAAATIAVGDAVAAERPPLSLIVLATGGLLIVFSMWWIYFEFTTGLNREHGRGVYYVWGYLHYFLFAGVAATGAALALSAAWLGEPAGIALPETGVALTVSGAVGVVLLAFALIESATDREFSSGQFGLKAGGAVLAVALAVAAPVLTVPGSVLATGLVLAALAAYGVSIQHRLHGNTAS